MTHRREQRSIANHSHGTTVRLMLCRQLLPAVPAPLHAVHSNDLKYPMTTTRSRIQDHNNRWLSLAGSNMAVGLHQQ
jgi:hypothetical protein